MYPTSRFSNEIGLTDILINQVNGSLSYYNVRLVKKDLKEIEYRIIQWLLNEVEEDKLPTSGEIIVVAEDLSPMETAAFTEVVKGVVTEKGGPTSHTAIICRQLGIPAIVACSDALKINNGTSLLVNPTLGTVEIDGKLNTNQKLWWQDLQKINSPFLLVKQSTVYSDPGRYSSKRLLGYFLSANFKSISSSIFIVFLLLEPISGFENIGY